MKALDYFIALLIGYNQAASTFAPKMPTWIAVISLMIYHLQRAGIFLFSTQGNPSLGTTVNRAISQTIKMFQIEYWEQITPLNYEGITIILFSIVVLGALVKARLLIFVRTREQRITKERLSVLFEAVFISWTLVFDKYFLYIPVLENCFYVFSQPGVKPYILTFAIFNLTLVLSSRISQSVLLFCSPYTNLKGISKGIAGEFIDIIGFVIMLGTEKAGSNISVYIGLVLTALQIVCLFATSKYADGFQNQIELAFQAFCFALGIDILLQHHVYHTQDFPFLLIAAFIYWGLRSLLRYRLWSLLRQFENPQLSNAMVQSLPLIFDEYFGNASLIESIYPIIAYRSNLRNEKNLEDTMMMIFSKEDFSFEDDPHKQKTFQAFIAFIETVYKEYIQATDISKSFLQSIMVSYLFFVKRVLKDHKTALVLLNDFRSKLKRVQVPMKFREKIEMILIEEECLQEAITVKGTSSLDIAKVFSVLDKTEDLKSRIINFIERKVAFLDSLKGPCLDLNLLKSTGVILTRELQALLKLAIEDSDFTYYHKPKELFAYFTNEVLQDPKILGFELKNVHSYRVFKEEKFKEITADGLIEKIQVNPTSPTFILVVNDCTVNQGKIMRCTKQLLARLDYLTGETSGLNFEEIVIAVNYQNHTFIDETKETNQVSDRKMCQVILKSRTGELISARGSIQHQIFDDIPCMVLLGEEEKSTLDNFMFCQPDGQIQGISSRLASALSAYNKPIGKFIQQILFKKDLESSSLLLGETYTRKTGLLKLQSSKDLNEEFFEIEFSVCPFGEKDTVSGTYKNYVVYLYPARGGALKDLLKIPQQKLVFSTNLLMSRKSMNEGQQSDPTPFETTSNNFAEKNGNFQITSVTEDDKTRFLTKFGSQSTLKPKAYTSKISEAEEESEHSDKSSSRKIEEVNDLVSEEFEDQKSHRVAAWAKRNASSAHYGSVQGSSRHQRKTEKAKQLITNHRLPFSIEWMRMLQLLACLTIFGYLIGDYLDLSRKFEILSQLSGITSFPLTLTTVMAAFMNYSEAAFIAATGSFGIEVATQIFSIVPGMLQNFFTTFQTQFENYVLQSNPSSYYSDFTYENYGLNLTLPDSPYLNREVKFNEALNTLRGFMGDLLFGILNGFQIKIKGLNFLRQEDLNYNEIFRSLSDDLFFRLSSQFDSLLLFLALRIIVGIVVAVTIGAAVLYTLFKLHNSSENLLSKFARIPESELDNEIVSLKQKAAYLQGRSEEVAEKKKPVVYSSSKKAGRSGVTISKKYKRLNQPRILHIGLSLVYCFLFLTPFFIAYDLKSSPVHSCVPLIKQYKLVAESEALAAGISAHFVEMILRVGMGDVAGALKLLNETEAEINEAKEASSSLYSMLNTLDSLQDDPNVSKNLIKLLQDLSNQAFCDNMSDLQMSAICKSYSGAISTFQFGVPALFKGAVEDFLVHRKQFAKNPAYAASLIAASDATILNPMLFSTLVQITLADIVAHYQSNFEEIADNAHHTLQGLLTRSLVYYCILSLLTLVPLVPWARKQYNKVKEIYTLLPTDVLISNPYIVSALKHR